MIPMRSDEHLFQAAMDVTTRGAEGHGLGNCWVWAVGTTGPRSHLARRYWEDHVRFQPTAFDYGSNGKGKQYAYHTMAFAAAYLDTASGDRLDLPYSLAQLQQITQGKTQESFVLRHRCGNAWCANPWHYDVAKKKANDLEEYCHHWLRLCQDYGAYKLFQDRFCTAFHSVWEPPCWTNNYDTKADLDPRRLSFTQPTDAEAAELAAEEAEEAGA